MQLLNFLRLIKSKSCKVRTLIYIGFGKQAHRIKTVVVGNDSIRGMRAGKWYQVTVLKSQWQLLDLS